MTWSELNFWPISGLQREAPCPHISLPTRLFWHLPQSIRINVCTAVSPSTPWGQRLSLIPLFVPRTCHRGVLREIGIKWMREQMNWSVLSKCNPDSPPPKGTAVTDTSARNPTLMFKSIHDFFPDSTQPIVHHKERMCYTEKTRKLLTELGWCWSWPGTLFFLIN